MQPHFCRDPSALLPAAPQLGAARSAVSVLPPELAALSKPLVKLCCSIPAAFKLPVPSYQARYYFLLFISRFVISVSCLSH